MTLRTRLAVAFFVVLLGPVLASAFILAAFLAKPGAREVDADRANIAVRMAVEARCRELGIKARAMATEASIHGDPFTVNPVGATNPWVLCGVAPSSMTLPPGARYGGLAARAEVRDRFGELTGYAYAVQALDQAFFGQLSAAAGGRVSLQDPGLEPGEVALASDASQPLPLVLSTVHDGGGFPVVPTAMIAACLVAGVMGRWLAGLATRPLGVLRRAVERAAAGDLTVRPNVSGRDEAALLGHGIDRLITDLQSSQHLSVTDALTGLGNVRHLADSLRLEIERASRFGRALGVLMLDLDHFKAVNDRFGHRAGDAVLVEFAARVRRVIREVDLAFRRGGEEFVILLPETDIAGSLTAARRIGAAVREQPFTVGNKHSLANGTTPDLSIPITVSIGIAVFPRHALNGTDILDAADEALYGAKAAGRDTFVLAGGVVPEQGRHEPPTNPTHGAAASIGSNSPASNAAG